MKQITLFFAAILLSLVTVAQAPASPKGGPMGINYQTVIRDGDGSILPDTELSLQMTIRTGAPDGEVVYAETHEATTNVFGMINLVIGYGSPLSNAFSDINWGDAEKYLETAIDLEGSGSYTIMGVTQFLSVPYAFESNHSRSITLMDENGNYYDVEVDTLGNLTANLVMPQQLEIGVEYQGGIIAYILQSGDPGYVEGENHGIIAAASDQSAYAEWGCSGTALPGANGFALGTGYQNTLDIVAGCNTAGIAARICNELELNGYSNWYLPSKDELNKLYLSKNLVGGFAAEYYWSSSEFIGTRAYIQSFSGGNQSLGKKQDSYHVRAVRDF